MSLLLSCLLTKYISDVGEKDTDDRRRHLIKRNEGVAMVLAIGNCGMGRCEKD